MGKTNDIGKAKVLVIMGSDSDLDAMKPCLETLESFSILFKVAVTSAHRTAEHTANTVKRFEAGGGAVIIAAAGGAAHLPGVVASLTPLPVIGVPIRSALLGLDSLLSIVQMPAGVPVATVGINASKNAALLATQILSVSDPALKQTLIDFRKKQTEKIIANSQKLGRVGYKNYGS